MMITENCATGTLEPYVPSADKPWNKARVQHLFRRMGHGIAPEDIEGALQQDPETLVDNLINEALNLPLPDEPEWANWSTADYDDFNTQRFEQVIGWLTEWLNGMLQFGFREKLALFWHNHFVTSFNSYQCPSYMYQYTTLLRQHALGNFKDFTVEMGKTPAMLLYLNGVQNTRFESNENYARELFELFTLGLDNGYTQTDIAEASRALTGWNGLNGPPYCTPINFVPFLFDNTDKTVFGQTGNWGYDELHDILFEQRPDEVAQHICTKIYRTFVHPEVDEGIVAGLAQTFKDHNFELAPVFRQLFKSEHFFDEYVIGTIIKSPVELFLNIIRESRVPIDGEVLQIVGYLANDLGQQILSPVDVKGWPGNRDWIDTNTMTERWLSLDFIVGRYYFDYKPELVQLAKDLSGNSIDPYEVTASIIDHFISGGLSNPEAYDRATTVFKWEVPQNYFDAGEWNLDWDTADEQIAILLRHLFRLPEFQLA